MMEAIKVLEKKLVEVRNQMGGCHDRIASAKDSLDNEELQLKGLLDRELAFNMAISVLKGE